MSPEGFDDDEMAENYRIYTLKKILFIVICIIAVVAVIGYAATIGSSNISATDVYRDIWYHFVDPSRCDPTIDWAVFDIRLPRIIGGLIVGSCLGVAGAAMQSMMKNPLADPYTTGISSGASFGAALMFILGISRIPTGGNYNLSVTLNAAILAMVPTLAIVIISKHRRITPTTMILAGIAVMYLFNACTTLIKLGISDESLSAVFQWSVGDLSQVTWSNCAVMCLFTVAGTAVLMAMSKKLNILITGDKNATALGLNAHRLRIVLLIIISLMAASVVCFTGIIGFIGLVAPHIVRIFLGSDNRYLIPASAAFGAVLLMVADLISRVVIAPTFLPVGVITAFIGCPMFLYLLIKQRRSMW